MPEELRQQLKLVKILEASLGLFLFILPWQTIYIYREVLIDEIKFEYATLGFYATEGLLWIIVVLFMTWYLKKFRVQSSEFRVRLTSDRVFVFSCLLFTVYCLLSIFWASDKSLALQQSLHILEAVLLFLIIFIGPFTKEKLAKWFIYGAILPAVLGIGQFLWQSDFASKWLGLSQHFVFLPGTSIVESMDVGRWLRAYGSFSHPNVFGGYLALVVIVVLSFAISRSSSEESRHWSLASLYPLFFVGIFYSFSRSAWLALFAGIIFFIWYFWKNKQIKIAGYLFIMTVILWVIFASLFLFLLKVRLPVDYQFSSRAEERSVEERLSGYGEAWQLFKNHPLIGVGTGNYTIALFKANEHKQIWEYQPVHNIFLLMLAELGVVGVVLLLLVVVSFFRFLILDFRFRSSGGYVPTVFMLLCLIVLMSFDHYLYSSYVGLMLTAVYFGFLFKNSSETALK